jgi:hypothetical protein
MLRIFWLAAVLILVGCASRHLSPKELLAANPEATEPVATQVHDAQRAARVSKAIDGLTGHC